MHIVDILLGQPLATEEEQAERIAISRYGVGTGLPLSKQAIAKERLQKRGKAGRHYGRVLFALLITRSVAH